MPGVYLDTALFVALAFTDDQYHLRAIDLTKELIRGDFGKPLRTSYAVFIETVAIIHRKSRGAGKNRRAWEKITRILLLIREYRIKLDLLSENCVEHAIQLYDERKGSLDFVDAINVSFLRDNNIQSIASFDGDYDQFGNVGITRIC